MARPIKKGIDYFPLDVNFLQDLKVRKVRRSCGDQAPLILLCVLAHVYQDEGYYLAWDEDVCFMIAEDTGVSEELVLHTVARAAAVGFFAQQLWQDQRILTSHGIQARYAKAAYQKMDHSLRADLVLLPGNVPAEAANVLAPDENKVNQVINPQSKEIANQTKREYQKSTRESSPSVPKVADDQSSAVLAVSSFSGNRQGAAQPQTATAPSSPLAQALAKELLVAIRQHLPRLRQPDLGTWAEVFQQMLTVDQRAVSELRQLIAWSQQDSFWQSVILDAKKFRQHFDQMAAQQQRPARSQVPTKAQVIIPSWLREQEAQEAQ
ncbi:DUF4373 domain-containing protein [Lapidilactobacillus salsurivasis]